MLSRRLFNAGVFLIVLTCNVFSAFSQTTVPAGLVSGQWSKAGSPYNITGDIVVPSNQKLVIAAGVELKFTGSFSLTVNGSLQAIGTAAEPIRFTVADSTGFSKGTHTGWKGIRFQNVLHADSSFLVYSAIEYAKMQGSNYGAYGSVYCNSFSKLRISNSVFRNNRTTYGGAIALWNVSNIRLRNILITGNNVSNGGGAIYAYGSTLEIRSSTISKNKADFGGAFTLDNSNLTIRYSTVVNNAANSGGAIRATSGNSIVIENSTVAGNTGAPEGIDLGGSVIRCKNTILWNRTDNSYYSEIAQYYTTTVVLENSIVKGPLNTAWKLKNTTSKDPLFVNLPASDVSLKWTNYPTKNATRSPAIDAGDIASPRDPDGTIADIGSTPYQQTSEAYPTASFSADTTLGIIPFTINFTDKSTQAQGPVASWNWDFGDGETATTANPTHVYTTAGKFQVKLIVTNQSGKGDTLSKPDFIRALGGTRVSSPTVSGTWTKANSPYNINNNITIPEGESLTIEPGVEVLFFGRYQIVVNGSLKAQGTKQDTIRFQGYDNAGWHSIKIEAAAASDSTLFEYCRIQNARYLEGDVTTNGGNAILVRNFNKVRVSHSLLWNNRGGRGAGVFCDHANIRINDNMIRNNSVDQYGGGIYVYMCSPIITGNTIKSNYGGTSAGGIFLDKSQSVIANNVITNNSCYWTGAGIVLSESNAELRNNVIAYNISDHDDGGGMAIYSSNPKIFNNTIAFNRAETGEGVYIAGYSQPVFVNTIIYSNRDRYENYNDGDELYLESSNVSATFSYCDIQGGAPNSSTGNNFDVFPMFNDTIKGDLSLSWKTYPVYGRSKSLCIDAGSPDYAHDPDGSRADVGAIYFKQDQKAFQPRPDFKADTLLGYNELLVHFTDLSDAGNGSITSWHWEFGDGTFSELQHPDHTYHGPGYFDVTLTIKDSKGFEKALTRRKYIFLYEGTYIKGNIDGHFVKQQYLVGGDLTIPEGKILTVDPGAKFIFMGRYKMNVSGSLKALGSAADPIIFTAHDTTNIQLKNLQGFNRTSGWMGIKIYVMTNEDSTIIDHCKVEAVTNWTEGTINAFSNGKGIRISNSEISFNATQGIYAYHNTVIRNNYIHHNYSYGPGAGIRILAGSPKIIGNIICSNTSGSDGGGIVMEWDGRPSLVNNVICHNYAPRGGGICDYAGGHTPINNTIAYNSAIDAGGYFLLYAGDVSFINSIIYHNTPDQIEIWDGYSRMGFTNSFLQGGKEGIKIYYSNVFKYENVSTSDPQITSGPYAHARPTPGSPVIDAGTLTDTQAFLPTYDLLGNARIQNSKVDIGAYEYTAGQAIKLTQPFADVTTDEDFDPFIIPIDGHITYPPGNKFLNFTIGNASQITLLHAEVKNRHLYLLPLKDRFGDQLITVTASDEAGHILNASFTVHISPVNDEPSFTVQGNLILNEDFSPAYNYAITFTRPFGEENETYTFSMTPDPDYVATNLSSGGTLSFTSKANLNGSDEFTIAVNDGQKSYAQSFDFAVSPVDDPLIVLINSQVITPANSKVSFLLGNSVTIPVSITDVDGDIVTLSASAGQSFIKPVVTNVSPNNFLVTISGTAEGTGYVTLYINSQGKTTTVSIQVKIDLITAIEEEPISIKVYPNPTDDFIFVEGDDLKGQATLVSVSGQVVSRTDVNGNFVKIDTKAMLTGIYLLKVTVRNNVYTYRVIKK